MTELATQDAFGVLTEPATLRIQRLLPGPIDRVWAYLTEGEMRRQWLAAGEMELKVGAPFELVWRNDELTNPPGQRPPGFSGEHRMQSRITELKTVVLEKGSASREGDRTRPIRFPSLRPSRRLDIPAVQARVGAGPTPGGGEPPECERNP